LLTREPLAVRAAIVAAVTGVMHALVVLGVLPIVPEAETAIAGAIDLVGTAVFVVWARGKVTPVADPKLPTATVAALAAKGPKHAA